MRWSFAISILLHAVFVAGIFISQRPAQVPSVRASIPESVKQNRAIIEIELPVDKVAHAPPKPPLEKSLAKKPISTVTVNPSPTPSFKMKQVEGAYQISISPSFTGANSAKPDVPPVKAEDERASERAASQD